MLINDSVTLCSLGLLISDNLVLSDLHLGYEEALTKKGVMIPKFQFSDIMRQLEKIFASAGKVKKVIITGDLKHEFGIISNEEWRNILKLFDYLLQHCEETIIVKGNHDLVLHPVAKKRGIRVVEQFVEKDVLYLHGDKLVEIPKSITTIVIGHEHPAVSIRDGSRSETFKCFLIGEYKGKKLMVMPSFHPLQEGHDLIKEKPISPYLQQDLSDFRVIIVGEKMHDFGRMRGLMH